MRSLSLREAEDLELMGTSSQLADRQQDVTPQIARGVLGTVNTQKRAPAKVAVVPKRVVAGHVDGERDPDVEADVGCCAFGTNFRIAENGGRLQGTAAVAAGLLSTTVRESVQSSLIAWVSSCIKFALGCEEINASEHNRLLLYNAIASDVRHDAIGYIGAENIVLADLHGASVDA